MKALQLLSPYPSTWEDCIPSPPLKVLWGFPGGSVERIHLLMQETWVWPRDQEDPVEKEWQSTPEGPGGLQPMG